MTAAIIIGSIIFIVVIILLGKKLNEHSIEKYDYKIFSILNLFLSFMGFLLLIISSFLYNNPKISSLNFWVTFVTGISVFLSLYIINLRKTNWYIAVSGFIYQCMVSSISILILFFVAFVYLNGSSRTRVIKKS